ncbi:nuclear matrix protein NMP200 [Coniophora puteana RWD-64-598 SS2]|uniref:Pre-mRNA-processing factor 19 n=1 Tax=Coniophora puteana (strain RWD-64-598) TaxID=741705 RepID=A0A5M3N5X1_CONPW|nr:nuclear matrix protein NMP200 [Coniophora puteana RWD-64-598 SS2]EIW86474.1 nuclear matrix protein NMP200 [Coniophora puteana RWD-64-598 SS2]
MSLTCSISGEPPQDPVVSTKTGHVYERRLILKYLADNGTDPVSGEKLEEADLISIKASAKAAAPRPPTATSIPALLHTFQNEWDALVLEMSNLRQQNNSLRQELSYALYAQDAANRVVARLIRERDSSREALSNVQASMGITPAPAGGDVEMAEENGAQEGLPKEIVDQMNETQAALSAARKKRKAPAGWATPAEVKTFTAIHTIPSLHSASPAGINSLAVSSANPSQFLTGGNDKIVQLYDRSTDKVLASLKGHTKKVNHVSFREKEGDNTLILSAGADKVAKIWSHDSASGEFLPKATIRLHKGELTGLAVHPTSTVAILGSADKTYSLHELTNFTQIYQSSPFDDPFSSLAVHPDGALLALGTANSKIQICDVRTGSVAATISPPDVETPFAVNSLSFSENGYHLLAPDSTSSVAIWDLRKMKAAHSIALGDGFKIGRVAYDYSAQFLGVAGSEGVRLFAHKTWDELARFEEAGDVSSIVFGAQGKEVWGTSGREVRIWGLPQ